MKMTVKACRAQVRATVNDLAKAVGVSRDTIYGWEAGKTAPKLSHAMRIVEFFNSKGLGISIDDINFLP